MQASDKPHFVVALTATATTFGTETDEFLIRGYWMALEDMDIDRVEKALAQALRRCQWMPKPVEIRKLAGEVPVEERIAMAWGEVLRLSSNCRGATHPDPVAESTIQKMGGWLSIGTRDADELKVWGRKQFAEIYEALAESAETRKALGDPATLTVVGEAAEPVRAVLEDIAGKRGM